MRKAGASGSTLLKGTSTSDSRQASSRAQRALQDKRTNITAADLDRKPMGTKRSRENDVPAEAPAGKVAKPKYGRVLVAEGGGTDASQSLSDTAGSQGSAGSASSSSAAAAAAAATAAAAAAFAPAAAAARPAARPTAAAARVKTQPRSTAPLAAAPVAVAPASAEPLGGDMAAEGGGGGGGGATSASSAPPAVRSGGGVAGDFMFEDGEHLSFKDKTWEKNAMPAAKRWLGRAKYGGTPDEFRRFALSLVTKRVALENYIKAHHEELRAQVAAAKQAATQKAVSDSNAIADFAKQITVTRKEEARYRALSERLGAELEALKRASAAAAPAAAAERDAALAKLHGELAAVRSQNAGLREVHEAEMAAAAAAAGAETQALRAELEAARDAAEAAARERAGAVAGAAAVGEEAAALSAAVTAGEAAVAAARAEAAAARDDAHAARAEVRELEEGLEAQVRESEEHEARAAALEARAAELSAALAKASGEAGVWQRRWSHVDGKRAALLEQVLSLKGAIRVFARVRPPIPGEVEEAGGGRGGKGAAGAAGKGAKPAPTPPAEPLFHFPGATADDACEVEVVERPGAGTGGYGTAEEGRRTTFKLQRVFPATAEQADVFGEVEGLVQSALDGHRVCIFAYGQTGSGKTWTMEGAPGSAGAGIIPRSMDLIFERLARMGEQGWAARLTVEMLEIHNETLRDLLPTARGASGSSSAAAAAVPALELRDRSGSPYVEGLSSHPVASAGDVRALLARASAARATATTAMNARSSRSHCVFTLRIAATHGATKQSRSGLLHLVDLAGSERIDKSGVNDEARGGSGKLLRETQAINSSLAALGDCVAALQARAPHVPYRNSKLTHLLSEALGAKDARTLVLCTLNPLHTNASESLSTLRFAERLASVVKADGPAGGKAAK